MTLTARQIVGIISAIVFMGFGIVLINILKGIYQLNIELGLVLAAEISAGFWGAVFGHRIMVGIPIWPYQRLTEKLIIVGILMLLIGLITYSIGIFIMALISYYCDSYKELNEKPLYILITVGFNGVIVGTLSLVTGLALFLLVVSLFGLGLPGVLVFPLSFFMMIGSLTYSGVWLFIPISIMAGWTLFFLGLSLRNKNSND